MDRYPSIYDMTMAAVIGVTAGLGAQYVRNVLPRWLERRSIPQGQVAARVLSWAILLVAAVVVLDQLGIEASALRQVLIVLFAALATACALALGLGSKDVVGGFVAGYFVRQRMQAGDEVKIAGMTGRVREIGPVATVIETEEDGLPNRHSIPNVRMLNEAVQ